MPAKGLTRTAGKHGEKKKKKKKPVINQLFGNDQQSIEGYADCERRLRHALAQEMAEKNASVEFAGAVKTVPKPDATPERTPAAPCRCSRRRAVPSCR